jgi:hypothetical protein
MPCVCALTSSGLETIVGRLRLAGEGVNMVPGMRTSIEARWYDRWHDRDLGHWQSDERNTNMKRQPILHKGLIRNSESYATRTLMKLLEGRVHRESELRVRRTDNIHP